MADLSAVAAAAEQSEEGVVITVYQPNGEPYTGSNDEPSTMTVLGPESKKVRAAKEANIRKMLKRKRRDMSVEELREQRVSIAASAVIGWSGWETEGAEAECTSANVREVLKYDHILEQVEAVIEAHSDFLGNSSTS